MGSKAAKRRVAPPNQIFQTSSLEQWKHRGVRIAKQPVSNKKTLPEKMCVLLPATLLGAVSGG